MIRALLSAAAAAGVAADLAGAEGGDGAQQAGLAAAGPAAPASMGRLAEIVAGGSAGSRGQSSERILFVADGGPASPPADPEGKDLGSKPTGHVRGGNVTASGGLAFLSETVSLQQQVNSFGVASPGCVSCCSSGQCMQAYMGQSAGMCCNPNPAMCCPQGATCANGQCSSPGAYSTPYGQPGNAQQGYGQPGYGPQPGYGGSPLQQLLRWVSQHMMLIWIILAILGCLGIGGPAVHYLQMALCGMSLFNCLCPGAANDLYGNGGMGGGYGGGYSGYGPAGGF